jgi:hypothetical protein
MHDFLILSLVFTISISMSLIIVHTSCYLGGAYDA